MTEGMLQIGDVAARCGLSLRTVRYYEEMGLLSPEKRTEGGFRLYTEEHVEHLSLIKQLKSLGFTVSQMRDVLDALTALSAADVSQAEREVARAKLQDSALAAAHRCEQLRTELAGAQETARRLQRAALGRPSR